MGNKRRGTGRTGTEVACNDVSSTLQLPVKTDMVDEEGGRAQIGIGAEDQTMDGIDADLEPDEWDRSCWSTTKPADSVDACPSSPERIGSWKDDSRRAAGKENKRGYKRRWNTGPRWGMDGTNAVAGNKEHTARQQALSRL